MPRKKLKKKTEGLYLEKEQSLEYLHSGSTLLDCILGGGYVLNRIVNIVGDKATSKTGAGIEASINFFKKFPNGKVVYAESEAAFDKPYAASLGMPIEQIDFREEENGIITVEDFYNDLNTICTWSDENDVPVLYVLDSLDALSDEAELERDFSEGTFGSKAKKMSELFRRMTKRMNRSKVTLLIISQIRDNIGITFGKSYTRSGGRALDFYASQIIYLAKIKQLVRTSNKIKRVTGVRIKAQCTKNKAGLPFRDCEYNYIFNYGIDDVESCLTWLEDNNFLEEYGEQTKKGYITKLNNMEDNEYYSELEKLNQFVLAKWQNIESNFAPTRKKY